jgi:hypothetical protein
MREDPLGTLLVDVAALDRQAIAEALQDYVGIDRATHGVVTRPGFIELSSRQKILAILLGRKAAALLGTTTKEGISPSDVATSSGIPHGTAKRVLRELIEDRLVSQDTGSLYHLAHHQVEPAIAELSRIKVPAGTNRPRRPTVRSRRKQAEQEKPAAMGATGPGVQKKSRKATGGGIAHIRDALEAGFFNSARTLEDLQAYLKTRQGFTTDRRQLSTNLLRLLRSGHIDREENEHGVYAYAKRTEGGR